MLLISLVFPTIILVLTLNSTNVGVDFFVNLYTHNVLEALKISVDCQNPDWVPEERQEKPVELVREQPVKTQHRKSLPEPNGSNPSEWTTADKLL